MDRKLQFQQVDRNYDFFSRNLASFLRDHRDEFALLRDERVVGFYATVTDADRVGRRSFRDGIYSIQEVTDEPIDLGIFSHAAS